MKEVARMSYQQRKQLMAELGADKLWSFSAVNLYHTSKYVYFLRYLEHVDPDMPPNVYGILGNLIHETIEKFYHNECPYGEMVENFENFWQMDVELLDIKFNRTDNEKNDKLKAKYHTSLTHFFNNHKPIGYPVRTEQQIIAQVDDEFFLGYIDFMFIDNDGNINIVDWKTSTVYSKKDMLEKGKQLLLYALAVHQMKGIPYSKIKCAWNFLKYTNVTITQLNGKEKVSRIERCQISEKLASYVKKWMNKLGYEEADITSALVEMAATNSIDALPGEVKSKFLFDDCYVYIDVNEDVISMLINDLSETVKEIREKTAEYKETLNDKLFWDDDEGLKAQSYYYINICDYSADKIAPLADYLHRQDVNKNTGLTDVVETKSFSATDNWLNDLFG